MKKEKALVNGRYLLQKFPGKGGWTFAAIPEVLQNKNNPFGWVKVRGSIDDFELEQYKLMPMGNGKLFLPVKAEIRKQIMKEEGDFVKIILFLDESKVKIPAEIVDCFKEGSKKAWKNFLSLSDGEQKTYIDWINKAKGEETKANRILQMISKVERNLKFYDKEN